MYFREFLDAADWSEYKGLLAKLQDVLDSSTKLFIQCWRAAERAAGDDPGTSITSVLMLSRHACESLDGVEIRAGEGGSIACKPLLRSGFEAYLSVLYILQEDTERRGLAYQLAHAHRRIKLYRSMDASHESGKHLRASLAKDPTTSFIRLPVMNCPALIANLERMFLRQKFAPIEAEWQRLRMLKKADPKWYQLFDGPTSVMALAHRVERSGSYELVYRQWSDTVHAGDALESIAANREGPSDSVVIRPLRHPDGLQELVQLACTFTIELGRHLVEHFGNEADQKAFYTGYHNGPRSKLLGLAKNRLFEVPWK